MKRSHLIPILLILGILLSSCGAIPTLPPLESTITIWTPEVTGVPALPTATGQVITQESTETPLESPTAPPETAVVTLEPTGTAVLPSATAAPTAAPTFTATPAPTATPEPSPTATAVPFSLQMMNPHYLPNFAHPELVCDWMGIAGQVFNKQGQVQNDLIIRAGGDLGGEQVVEEMTMPLAEPEFDLAYGPGGFELTLANSPVASDSTVWIQLFSLDGYPLSEQIFLITYDDCQKNLILVNFVEE